MNLGKKLLIGILSILFIITFFLTELISGGITEIITKQGNGLSYVFLGLGCLLINVIILFVLISIFKKHINKNNIDKIKAFFCILLAIPICLNLYVPFVNPYPMVGLITYSIIYILIILLYYNIIKNNLKK